jgi:hypothetical protein
VAKGSKAKGKSTTSKAVVRSSAAGRFVAGQKSKGGKTTPASGRQQSASTSRTTRGEPAVQEEAPPQSHQMLALSLLNELSIRDPDGRRLSAADLDQAAALAAEHILSTSTIWVEKLGAFYDTDGVRALLARDGEPISRQAVNKRKGLLALTTGNGRVVYPAFQFEGRRLIEGLDEILSALPPSLVSRWTVASWLTSPEVALEGERPIDVLAHDGAAGRSRVAAVAAQWAAQLEG